MRGRRALPFHARESHLPVRRPRRASAAPGLPVESVLERQLKTGIREIPDPDISAAQIKVLSAYCRLVAQWNQAYNLVGPRTLPEIVPRHILDSLLLSSFLPPGARRILDLGTGAGLPGLPLAVAHPDRRFTLLDRNRKKTRFVRQAKMELNLSNIEVVTDEAKHYRGGPFECIMARAVSSLAELVRSSAHLVAAGGVYLLPKGSEVEQELRELPRGWDAAVKSLKRPANRSPVRTVVVLRAPDADMGIP